MWAARLRLLPAWCWALVGCVLLMAVTRLPLVPPRLYYFDSVNFALALREFNPALHQPQPPGYPLYVLVCRLIASVVSRPEWVFALAGVLGGAVAATAAKVLGDRMFGRPAGWLAAIILMINPVFWFGGVTNQVRVYLATGSTLVALLCWQAWHEPARKWIYLAAGSLGLLAGFRPELSLVLSPLFAAALLRKRRSWWDYPTSAVCLTACLSLWLVPTALQSGGFAHYLSSVSAYASDQFHGSSLIFGAAHLPARKMMTQAVVWNFLGVLTWGWCLAFLRRGGGIMSTETAWFLAIWFVPPFLFQAFIHVADPDQTLATVPVVCLLGGAVVRGFLQRVDGRPKLAALALAGIAGLNLYLFLGKPPRFARDTSYRTVHMVGTRIDTILSSLERMQKQGPIQIVWMGSTASWRQVGYYLPDVPVIVVEDSIAASAWTLTRNRRNPPSRAGEIKLDADRTIVFLGPEGPQWEQRVRQSVSASRSGHLLYLPARHGLHFSIDGMPFTVL